MIFDINILHTDLKQKSKARNYFFIDSICVTQMYLEMS